MDEVMKLAPKIHYLEIYAKSHNWRPNVFSVGNQVKTSISDFNNGSG
jgi:N6-adenosine-specific RNA methylase IME4